MAAFYLRDTALMRQADWRTGVKSHWESGTELALCGLGVQTRFPHIPAVLSIGLVRSLLQITHHLLV